jgi:hypothetical protein
MAGYDFGPGEPIVDKKTCPVLVDGKECGLELLAEETEEAKLLGLHRCPFGHRVYSMYSKKTSDPTKSKSKPPSDRSKN